MRSPTISNSVKSSKIVSSNSDFFARQCATRRVRTKGTDRLLTRIRVVKAYDERAVVHFSKVLVEHGGFGVANVEVATGLWGKTRDDLSVDSAGEPKCE